MRNNFKNLALSFMLLLSMFTVSSSVVAQEKRMKIEEDQTSSSIVMNWNKNTPESEMDDDIKALKKHGVTVKYSNLKRNAANEITAIKVSFSDDKGNIGEMNLDYKKAINDISIYKIGDEVGFGAPENSMPFGIAGIDGGEMLKNFKFDDLDGNSKSFTFAFPEDGLIKKQSKIIIKDPEKKELIIENGEIVEGGEDYSKEELEEIKKKHSGHGTEIEGFIDLRDEDGIKKFSKTIKKVGRPDEIEELNAAKEELNKAKEELQKAREELQKASENLNKNAQKKK